jgi:hypothetical protein
MPAMAAIRAKAAQAAANSHSASRYVWRCKHEGGCNEENS